MVAPTSPPVPLSPSRPSRTACSSRWPGCWRRPSSCSRHGRCSGASSSTSIPRPTSSATDAVELDPATGRGEIRFDHVHFAYHSAEPVLSDVSFEAQPGTLVAFVGPSGAGKSTILNLVARLYDHNEGGCILDDVDLRDLIRQPVGRHRHGHPKTATCSRLAAQRHHLGAPDATDAEIEKAASGSDPRSDPRAPRRLRHGGR